MKQKVVNAAASVSAVCHEWKDGVPMDLSATIYFDGPGAVALEDGPHCSFIHGFDQYCRISARANRPGYSITRSTDDFVIPRHPASASSVQSFGGAFEDVLTCDGKGDIHYWALPTRGAHVHFLQHSYQEINMLVA